MQGSYHNRSIPPRYGEPPPAGHWAEGRPVPGYLAYGFDCLAEKAGMADGLSALLRACGVTIGQVDAADAARFRDWYCRCYAEYSGEPLSGAWDVVAFSAGIYGFDSGWCPPSSRH